MTAGLTQIINVSRLTTANFKVDEITGNTYIAILPIPKCNSITDVSDSDKLPKQFKHYAVEIMELSVKFFIVTLNSLIRTFVSGRMDLV